MCHRAGVAAAYPIFIFKFFIAVLVIYLYPIIFNFFVLLWYCDLNFFHRTVIKMFSPFLYGCFGAKKWQHKDKAASPKALPVITKIIHSL